MPRGHGGGLASTFLREGVAPVETLRWIVLLHFVHCREATATIMNEVIGASPALPACDLFAARGVATFLAENFDDSFRFAGCRSGARQIWSNLGNS